MTVAAEVDWTMIATTAIITVPAVLSALFAFLIHRAVQTPSGSKLGAVVELTHDLSAVDVALTKAVHAKVVDGGDAAVPPRSSDTRTRRGDG